MVGTEDKKAKGTEIFVINRKLKFAGYKNCLEAAQLENKMNHLKKLWIFLKGDHLEIINTTKI